MFIQGRWAQAYPETGASDRRAPDTSSAATPTITRECRCSPGAASLPMCAPRRRAIRDISRRRSAALVPLPIRRDRTAARPCSTSCGAWATATSAGTSTRATGPPRVRDGVVTARDRRRGRPRGRSDRAACTAGPRRTPRPCRASSTSCATEGADFVTVDDAEQTCRRVPRGTTDRGDADAPPTPACPGYRRRQLEGRRRARRRADGKLLAARPRRRPSRTRPSDLTRAWSACVQVAAQVTRSEAEAGAEPPSSWSHRVAGADYPEDVRMLEQAIWSLELGERGHRRERHLRGAARRCSARLGSRACLRSGHQRGRDLARRQARPISGSR